MRLLSIWVILRPWVEKGPHAARPILWIIQYLLSQRQQSATSWTAGGWQEDNRWWRQSDKSSDGVGGVKFNTTVGGFYEAVPTEHNTSLSLADHEWNTYSQHGFPEDRSFIFLLFRWILSRYNWFHTKSRAVLGPSLGRRRKENLTADPRALQRNSFLNDQNVISNSIALTLRTYHFV